MNFVVLYIFELSNKDLHAKEIISILSSSLDQLILKAKLITTKFTFLLIFSNYNQVTAKVLLKVH